ncbi:MAG: DUF5671 domain-containing protein [Candidatus Peribacteraceae bacterium]|nr:DUF5671 domain-containing protein [Candidatus Peribacteraceae bacterium]
MAKNSDHAKHAFFYLVAFFGLGFVATAIGQVVFQLINQTIVETTPSYYGDYSQGILRFAISSLIIAGPIYYFATRKINTALAKKDLDPDSAIRKWLTYIAIFVASAVAIGDLIFVLNSFLSGELTLKFLLKAATIFVIVGGFGWYYLTDLQRKNYARDAKIKAFGITFIAVTLVCLVTAFSIVDSPWRAREVREDRERLNELQQITYSVPDFYRQNSALPQDLSELVSDSRIREEVLRDPVTDEQYEYTIIDPQSYQICANFTHANADEEYLDPAWEHAAGRACFAVDVSEKGDYPIVDVKPVRSDF